MITQSKAMTIAGWIFTGLIGVFLIGASAVPKFMNPPMLAEMMEKLGWSMDSRIVLGTLEVVCTVLFLIPQTAVLGAILLTGYLGGAIATHVRIHDQFIASAVIGVLAWLALYLRDPRIRALLPINQKPSGV